MAKYLIQILTVLVGVYLLASCEDEKYLNSADAQLKFSTDTVMFDTIFTTIGSTTRHFKVYNPYSEKVLISKVSLAGGDASSFRLNINGVSSNDAYEIEVPPKDSIYIFVEVTIDPNGQSLPMVVKDSIVLTINDNFQNIKLIAWGQDFNLIKSEVLKSTTWNAQKPYLVYNYAYVDSLETLTIEPGTKVFFHKGAGLYAKGNIVANGTFENPIIFQGDRLETDYADIPDQWNGILLFSGSHDNVFNFATIKNANIGLQVGTLEQEGHATVSLTNSRIENMAYAGIFSLKSEIYSYNSVIANCGYYAVALLIGGDYEFYHSTIANYWGRYSIRNTSSLVISNVLVVEGQNGEKVEILGDLGKANFGNCIIYGNQANEIELGQNEDVAFNYLFDHCILQVPDTFKTDNKDHYISVWKGVDYDPGFIDPYDTYNYQLDTLSPAKDVGSDAYSTLFPLDLNNESRLSDDGPDLGAFERIEDNED